MLLSDRDLRGEVESGRLVVEPFDDSLVQPSSIDVRLDRFFRVFNNTRYTHIDPAVQQDDLTSLVEAEGDDPFVLHPGEFVLGSTYEQVTLPDDLAGRLEGKSSLGRLGLLTHSTAGFIDPGFTGHITLELSNVANLPITLWPGMFWLTGWVAGELGLPFQVTGFWPAFFGAIIVALASWLLNLVYERAVEQD